MSTTPFVKFKQDLGDNKFALNTAGYGMTESGLWLPIKVTDEGVQEVRLSGNIVELGLLADRPTATPENKGMGYFAWDAPEGNKLTYSDGTKWVVI